MLLRDTVHQISRGESAAAVLFLSRDVKNTKFNQYLPVLLMSLNVSDSRFRKLVMFWMWRHHDMELWRHGGGAWHNGLILTTASNGNSWADVAKHVTRLWQAGDTENLERRITGYLWAVSRSRTDQSRHKETYSAYHCFHDLTLNNG